MYHQTFLPPSYSFASPCSIIYSAISILPTLTEASNLKYLSLPKSYKTTFSPLYNSLSNSSFA